MNNDLTLPIIIFIVLLGYYIKNVLLQEIDLGIENFMKGYEILGETKPSEIDPYTSNRVNEVNKEMLNKSFDMYKKSERPQETGVINPLFNQYPDLFMNTTGKNVEYGGLGKELNTNPISYPDSTQLKIRNQEMNLNGNTPNLNIFTDSSLNGISVMPMFNNGSLNNDLKPLNNTEFFENTENTVNPLTDLPYEKTHNNMQPFYGSTMKQNTDMNATKKILDLYTGNTDTFIHKKENGPMFKLNKESNNAHVFATPLITDNIDLDRFIPSNFRQGEKPFQPVRVPAEFQGSINDNIRPQFKTIDEMRASNKPQITYAARNVDGQKGELFWGKDGSGEFQQKGNPREIENKHILGGQNETRMNTPYLSPNFEEEWKITNRQFNINPNMGAPKMIGVGNRVSLKSE
jgi:hypothetical protein